MRKDPWFGRPPVERLLKRGGGCVLIGAGRDLPTIIQRNVPYSSCAPRATTIGFKVTETGSAGRRRRAGAVVPPGCGVSSQGSSCRGADTGRGLRQSRGMKARVGSGLRSLSLWREGRTPPFTVNCLRQL